MTTITTATIQSMLARNARDIGLLEATIDFFKRQGIYYKSKLEHAVTPNLIFNYKFSIENSYKGIAKSRKQVKTLASIQRQLKDEIRERKAYNVALKSFWEERNA